METTEKAEKARCWMQPNHYGAVFTGEVTKWFVDKKYGFIWSESIYKKYGMDSLFFHGSNVDQKHMYQWAPVSFILHDGRKNMEARRVAIIATGSEADASYAPAVPPHECGMEDEDKEGNECRNEDNDDTDPKEHDHEYHEPDPDGTCRIWHMPPLRPEFHVRPNR